MPIPSSISHYVELGDLLFQCNKKYKPDLFTIDFDLDEKGHNRTGYAVLIHHKVSKPSCIYKKQVVEKIKKELAKILGEQHGR